MGLKRIKRAVKEDHYQFSAHALEQADEDSLTEEDVRHAILNGVLSATLTDDPRGERFIVCGISHAGDCRIEVVCRFLPSGLLRIITVWTLEE
jgi:hypothetical protein